MNEIELPSISDLYNPVLKALHLLGGEGHPTRINTEVCKLLGLSAKQLSVKYSSQQPTNRTVISGRIGTARSHLKKAGYLCNRRRRKWRLTDKGRATHRVDPRQVYRVVSRMQIARSDAKLEAADAISDDTIAARTGLPLDYGDKSMSTIHDLPPAQELLMPTIQALREMGGKARKRDVSDRVKNLAQLSNEQTEMTFASGTSVFSVLIDQVRKILLTRGLISIPDKGIYQLTDAGWAIGEDELTKLSQTPSRRRATRSTPAVRTASLPHHPNRRASRPADRLARATARLPLQANRQPA